MTGALLKDVMLVGLGAVGAMYALILERSKFAQVTVVARSNYDIVNTYGLKFQSAKYGAVAGWKPFRICRSVVEAADRSYTYVVIATKVIPEIIRTSEILAPLLSSPYSDHYKQPIYVLLQNGLNVEVDLYNALKQLDKGAPKIVSAGVYITANLLAPNVVEHGNFDRLTIGMFRFEDFKTISNTPEEMSILQDIGNIFVAGGTEVSIVPEIQRQKFRKNIFNVVMSSVSTLTRYRLTSVFRAPPTSSEFYEPYTSPRTADFLETYTVPNLEAITRELVALGHAMGFPDNEDGLPTSFINDMMNLTREIHSKADSTHKPSMLLDSEQDLPIEVEVILGEVVRLGKKFKVEMPRTEMLYALLLIIQNQTLRKMEGKYHRNKL